MKRSSCFRGLILKLVLASIGLLSPVSRESLAQTNCSAPSSGLIGWWRAEGDARDAVGANHGVLSSGLTFGAGETGQAFALDGTSYLTIPASSSLNVGLSSGLTLEAWVNPSTVGSGRTLLEWNSGAGTDPMGVHFHISTPAPYGSGDGCLYANLVDTAGTNHILCSAPGMVGAGMFQHVAMSYDAGSGMAELYVNGASVARTNFGSFTPQTSYDMYLGRRVAGPWVPNWVGLIDEVSVYSRGLSQAEIQRIYSAASAGKCAAAPPIILVQPTDQATSVGGDVTFTVTAAGSPALSYNWRFNGTNLGSASSSDLTLTNVQLNQAGSYAVTVTNQYGSVQSSNASLLVPVVCAAPPAGLVSCWRGDGDASDSAGTNAGILAGNVTFAPGRVAQTFAFDGRSDAVVVGNPASLQLQDFTIEAWVQRTSATLTTYDQPNGNGMIFGFGSGGYGLYLDPNGTPILTRVSLDDTRPNVTIRDLSFHHLAVTKSGANVVFYVDGVSYAAPAYDPGFSFSTVAAIGARGDFLYNSFLGLIDELSIYNRALSALEIQSIYAAANLGKCVIPVAPFIRSQPSDQSATLGGDATFSVSAGGTPPLRYQWNFGSAPLSGATASVLKLTGITSNQAGLYSIQVSNSYGSITSSNAALSIVLLATNFFDDFEPGIDLPQWAGFGGTVLATNYGGSVSPSNSLWFGGDGSRYATTRPLNTSNGGRVRFYLRIASGGAYPWEMADLPGEGVVLEYATNASNWLQLGRYDTSAYFNWTNISLPIPTGAQAPSVQFRWRQLSNSGALFDHWALDDVLITTGPTPPAILAQPQNQTVLVGATASFSVTADGSAPLAYQWLHNSAPVGGATSASLVLSNVQVSQAGNYAVIVTNLSGSVSSSNALLTVNLPPATVKVVSVSNTPAGGTCAVPIELVANGNENALGFSLSFNPSLLSYSGASLGSGAAGGTLFVNSSQAANGRLGLILALPANSTFVAGIQEAVQISFVANIVTSAAEATIAFGDSPIGRQLTDAPGNNLPVSFEGGTVSIAAVEFESDIFPRPGGNRAVTINDWVLAGRYAARLDYPTNAVEFQRADSAPRSTLGDGAITVIDWVQAGRYAAGLDALTPIGGPTSEIIPPNPPLKGSDKHTKDLSRQLEVLGSTLIFGQTGTVSVVLQAQGNENALGFSLTFDPAALSYTGFSVGGSANGATLNLNPSGASAGRIAAVLALGTGSSFPAGSRELLKITFRAIASTAGEYPVSFSNQPVPCQVSDSSASVLSTLYTNGTIVVNPLPVLKIAHAGQDIALTWPLWATNFVLQEAAGTLAPGTVWSNHAVGPTLIGDECVVTLPLNDQSTFYRLRLP